MTHSRYFSELAFAYDGEINDLLTDSEGKTVFKARLAEKRRELTAILPMIEFSPEMVLPVFFDAFRFPNRPALLAACRCEPDEDDFPTWDALVTDLQIEDWAKPLIEQVLAESAGEMFMVSAACLEFIRQADNAAPARAAKDDEEQDEENDENSEGRDDDEDGDLAEMGDDWLAEQGFDSRNA
jgi:hypothetical protein